MDTEYLIPEQIAPILGCAQYSINVQARDDPYSFGFPVIKIGTRVRIPRIAFLRFMRGEVAAVNRGCVMCEGNALLEQKLEGHRCCVSCGRRLPTENAEGDFT